MLLNESLCMELSADDIAAVERLAGRPATTDDQRGLLLKSLPRMRERHQVLRTSSLAEDQSPAIAFHLPVPATKSADDGVVLPVSSIQTWDGEMGSLAFAPVFFLAELIRAQRVTSRQLVELCLDRMDRFAPDLYCVVSRVSGEVALAEADRADAEIASGNYRGPLHGIPYGVKDSFATVHLPTTDGVRRWADRILGYDAEAVKRLRDAGAVLLAKLSMGELAMDDVWFGGKTRNPWFPEAGSSGSSAGSASAVAAGLLPFALGGETWGSIISPSAICGTTGLRPTFGRLPRTGVSALSWSLDKIGPMTRSVADCALIMDVLRGADGADVSAMEAPFSCDFTAPLAGLRVGYDVAGWDALSKSGEGAESLLAMYNAAKETMERLLGTTLIPVHLPEMTPEYNTLPMGIIDVEGAASYAAFIADGGLDELVRQGEDNWPNIFRLAQTVPATEYLQAQRVRSHLQSEISRVLEGIDAYITPSCWGESLRYTNLTGHPEVITRCGFTEVAGMPVSLSIVGDLWNESAALRVAYAYEQEAGWHTRTPKN
ncbi:MAG: amidase [Fibrella sp.]|nr:amidase [Armatimonadota bacterium]